MEYATPEYSTLALTGDLQLNWLSFHRFTLLVAAGIVVGRP